VKIIFAVSIEHIDGGTVMSKTGFDFIYIGSEYEELQI
jgi:hypothetical protein